MPKRIADQRTRHLGAAQKTNYRYEPGNTAIADIAKEAGIPLLLQDQGRDCAITDLCVRRFRKLLEEFDETASPNAGLCEFVNVKIKTKNREELPRPGCPVGTFCSDCASLAASAAEQSTLLFRTALAWTERQIPGAWQGRTPSATPR